MRKAIVVTALSAVVAFFAAVTPTTALAQKDKGKGSGGATVEINEGKDGKFRFTIRNAEGKGMAQSLPPGGFATAKDAAAAFEALKAAIPTAKVVMPTPKKDK
jgi:uncharacterized protein YegP (UPF0339 family)